MGVDTKALLEARLRSAAERAAIDASCRGPVLFFASSAVFWLLAGTLLAVIASTKLHSPYFLTGNAELTFGRVPVAHVPALSSRTPLSKAALPVGRNLELWHSCRCAGYPVR